MDLPDKSGVPVGTGPPVIAGSTTVFVSFVGKVNNPHSIGGTRLELEADAAATTGNGDVQVADLHCHDRKPGRWTMA